MPKRNLEIKNVRIQYDPSWEEVEEGKPARFWGYGTRTITVKDLPEPLRSDIMSAVEQVECIEERRRREQQDKDRLI